MSPGRLPARMIQFVRRRAKNFCEYCLLHQCYDLLPHHVDHVIARKHQGSNTEDNLALACVNCSLAKGPNIAGRDARTGKLSPLFDPRVHVWNEHFRWRGPLVIGRTIIGRATVAVLNMNRPDRVALRRMLIAEEIFPPA